MQVKDEMSAIRDFQPLLPSLQTLSLILFQFVKEVRNVDNYTIAWKKRFLLNEAKHAYISFVTNGLNFNGHIIVNSTFLRKKERMQLNLTDIGEGKEFDSSM